MVTTAASSNQRRQPSSPSAGTSERSGSDVTTLAPPAYRRRAATAARRPGEPSSSRSSLCFSPSPVEAGQPATLREAQHVERQRRTTSRARDLDDRYCVGSQDRARLRRRAGGRGRVRRRGREHGPSNAHEDSSQEKARHYRRTLLAPRATASRSLRRRRCFGPVGLQPVGQLPWPTERRRMSAVNLVGRGFRGGPAPPAGAISRETSDPGDRAEIASARPARLIAARAPSRASPTASGPGRAPRPRELARRRDRKWRGRWNRPAPRDGIPC